jgi:dihydrodipicolinate synthase/N-acetylneuraminate lyase
MPPNTSIDISIELCVDLASHPNIIGMKDSGGDVSNENKTENFQ